MQANLGRPFLNSGDKRMVRQIVERCHVADSDERVVKYLLSRVNRGAIEAQPGLVSLLAKEAVKAHRKNQELYMQVMGGRL